MDIGNINTASLNNKILNAIKQAVQQQTPELQENNVAKAEGVQNPVVQNPKTMLADVLKNAGLKVTTENLKLLELLFEHEMPLNKDTVIKLNQALKMMGGDVKKAMFFLKNEMLPTTSNAQVLNGIVSQQLKLAPQLENLISALEQMPEGIEKQTILKLLIGEPKASHTAINSESQSPRQQAASAMPERNITPAAAQNHALPGTQQQHQAQLQDGGISRFVPKQQQNLQQEELLGTALKPLETVLKNTVNIDINNTPQIRQFKEELIRAFVQNDLPAQSKPVNQNAVTEKLGGIIKNIIGEKGLLLPKNILPAIESEIFRTGQEVQKILNNIREGGNGVQQKPQDAANATINPKGGTETSLQKAATTLLADVLAEGEPLETAVKINKLTSETILERFSIDPRAAKKESIDDMLNDLKQTLAHIKTVIPRGEAEPPFAKILNETIDNINKNLDFQNQMKNSIFVQIPVIINEKKITASLFVFKDKRVKRSKPAHTSALLALDLLGLGHVEAYIQKNNNAVSCQFRLQEKTAEMLVRQNINDLIGKLYATGYSLDGISFKHIEEPFTVIEKEPQIDKGISETPAGGIDAKRMFFDVKV